MNGYQYQRNYNYYRMKIRNNGDSITFLENIYKKPIDDVITPNLGAHVKLNALNIHQALTQSDYYVDLNITKLGICFHWSFNISYRISNDLFARPRLAQSGYTGLD